MQELEVLVILKGGGEFQPKKFYLEDPQFSHKVRVLSLGYYNDNKIPLVGRSQTDEIG